MVRLDHQEISLAVSEEGSATGDWVSQIKFPKSRYEFHIYI
jgi:hypothetical protein